MGSKIIEIFNKRTFKSSSNFRRTFLLAFYTAMILLRTVLNREIWFDPLGKIFGGWGLYEDGQFTTESIENFMLFVPFSILLLWAFQKELLDESENIRFGKTVWEATKVVAVFSFMIEFTQLLFHLGTFQISDLTNKKQRTAIGALGDSREFSVLSARRLDSHENRSYKMAGRPKKKPEYNPELQFNHFLQELRDAYEEADSLRSLANELNISLLKLRKLLITADVFTSDICTGINDLYQSGKKIPEVMKLTGLSRASVHSYLPYTKGIYNAAEISLNAERCRTYKIRQEKVRLLKEIPSEENLWQSIIAFQNYPFKTATGLPFRYKLKVGKNGEYNRELLIDRREKSKSLAWSSVVLAFENSKRISEEVKKPKALGDIRGVSYIYPILWRFGLIRVPEAIEKKMGKQR